jgi:sugar transporter
MVLYIAMAVFALAFVVLLFIPISDPEGGSVTESTVFEASPWSFRHFVLGAIGIFLYVGIEVGIPGTLIFYLSDTTEKGGGILGNAASIAGTVAATYWFLMLVGRFTAGFIANLVSSKTMMVTTSCVGMILVIAAIVLGKSTTMLMPVFTGESFQMTTVPVAALLLVLCGLCTSVMWSSIFNLATEGLGKYTAAASGIFMMMVVGGGVLPLIQSFIADKSGYLISYIVPLAGLAYLFFYAIIGSKNINKDIPV